MLIEPFHSIKVPSKNTIRTYHNNSSCTEGNYIALAYREEGTGGFQLCRHCERKTAHENYKKEKKKRFHF